MRVFSFRHILSPTYICFYGLLLFICLIPIYLTQIPPLVDYPNHLARMHILLYGSQSELLRQFYTIQWAVLPNLAMDLFVPNMASFMELDVAAKTFIGLIFLLMSGGTIALHYTLHRRISIWPFLAFLFIYNRTFLWGFLNYLFGVGLFLCVLAAWIFLRERSNWLRIVLFPCFSVLLFFSHLSAFGLYGSAIIGYEFGRYRARRKKGMATPPMEWIISAVQFFIPVILFIFLTPTAEAHSFKFGDLWDKIKALFDVVNNYNLALDWATFLLLVGLFVVGYMTRKIEFAKPMVWPLIFIAAICFCMPKKLLSGNYADNRIPIAFVLLLVASTNWRLKNLYWKTGLMVLLLTIFLLRMAVITTMWQSANREYAEYLQAIDKMQDGSRLYTVISQTPPDSIEVQPPVSHLASLAVIKKSAFVPSMFVHPDQQPLAFTPPYQVLDAKTPQPVFRKGKLNPDPFPSGLLAQYDYMLVVDEKGLQHPLPENLEPIFTGRNFRLFKILPLEIMNKSTDQY